VAPASGSSRPVPPRRPGPGPQLRTGSPVAAASGVAVEWESQGSGHLGSPSPSTRVSDRTASTARGGSREQARSRDPPFPRAGRAVEPRAMLRSKAVNSHQDHRALISKTVMGLIGPSRVPNPSPSADSSEVPAKRRRAADPTAARGNREVRALPTSHADRAAAARRRARRPPGRGGKRFEDMGRRASVESYEVAAESGEHSVR